jgi:Rrf2 family transcriptional regulator, iron-sulfur cluster assembly transcription factor
MFSKSCEYALRGVLYLAVNSTTEYIIDAKNLAEALSIPQPYLSKVLQKLSKQNLISSVKGPHGGFFLSEDNLQNSVLQIIECIDGEMSLKSCVMGLETCSSNSPCLLHRDVLAFRDGLKNALAQKSISAFISG